MSTDEIIMSGMADTDDTRCQCDSLPCIKHIKKQLCQEGCGPAEELDAPWIKQQCQEIYRLVGEQKGNVIVQLVPSLNYLDMKVANLNDEACKAFISLSLTIPNVKLIYQRCLRERRVVLLHTENGEFFILKQKFHPALDRYFNTLQCRKQFVRLDAVELEGRIDKDLPWKEVCENKLMLCCCIDNGRQREGTNKADDNEDISVSHASVTAHRRRADGHVLLPRNQAAVLSNILRYEQRKQEQEVQKGKKNKNLVKKRSKSAVSKEQENGHPEVLNTNADENDDRVFSIQENNTGAKLLLKLRELTALPSKKLDIQPPNENSYIVIAYPVRRTKHDRPRRRRQQSSNQANNCQGQGSSELRMDSGSVEQQENLQESFVFPARQKEDDVKFPTQETEEGREKTSALHVQNQFQLGKIPGAIPSPAVRRQRNRSQQARYPGYEDASNRRSTFDSWPKRHLQDPEEMITYGFFYTGQDDLVRCFWCGIGLKDWDSPEDPMFEHIKHSADCPFLLLILGQNLLDAYKANLLPGKTQHQAARSHITQGESRVDADAVGEGAAASAPVIRSPQFADLNTRLSSFMRWPDDIVQTPSVLAEAGFYYTGFGDVVRCFACDGGLQKWDPQDDPWVEHTRWFPECHHIRQVKGDDYVELVQRAIQASSSDEEDSDTGDTEVVTDPALIAGMESMTVGNQASRSYEELQQEREQADPIYKASAQSVIAIGYSRSSVRMAMEILKKQGVTDFTAENILTVLMEKEEQGEMLPRDEVTGEIPPDTEESGSLNEDDPQFLFHQNQRLKHILKCIICHTRENNMLFLPCTHHRVCELCALDISICPECNSQITKKVKTYMA